MDKKIDSRYFVPFLSTRELKTTLKDDSSARSLLFSNLFTIAIALLEHWNLRTVLFIYWGQNIIIGFFNVLRLLNINKFNARDNLPPALPLAVRCIPAGFFALHYGLFHFVYLQFIGLADARDWKWVWVSLIIFFLHHLYSFRHNFPKEVDAWNFARLMSFPYIRIVPMHIIIIFGGFLTLLLRNEFADRLVLIFFLLLKTNADLKMHQAEHAWQKEDTKIPDSCR